MLPSFHCRLGCAAGPQSGLLARQEASRKGLRIGRGRRTSAPGPASMRSQASRACPSARQPDSPSARQPVSPSQATSGVRPRRQPVECGPIPRRRICSGCALGDDGGKEAAWKARSSHTSSSLTPGTSGVAAFQCPSRGSPRRSLSGMGTLRPCCRDILRVTTSTGPCRARLLDLAWPGRSCGLESSLSDLLGPLSARVPSARLSDGAGPA
jgi:hypothetical protein